jgi:hypothetical protein
LGFDIEEATERAIRSHGRLLAQSSGARLYEELIKDLANETRPVFEALGRFNILGYILGRAGEDLEADPAIFSRLCALLEIKDRAVAGGLDLSLEETSSLVFWPWMEGLFAGVQGDMHPILNKAFEAARTGATLPRSLRANVIQILIIVEHMQALKRADAMVFAETVSLRAGFAGVLHHRERPDAGKREESFESLFQVAYPSEPAEPRHRWFQAQEAHAESPLQIPSTRLTTRIVTRMTTNAMTWKVLTIPNTGPYPSPESSMRPTI